MNNMKRYEVVYYLRRTVTIDVDVPNGDDPYEYANESLNIRDDEECYDADYSEIDGRENDTD